MTNTLVVMLDDARSDELAFMPNVRRIAAAGTTFTQARQPTPICSASRAGFLLARLAVGPNGTGISSQSHNWNSLDAEQVPVWLQSEGVTTQMIGKHAVNLTTQPRPGWDRWHVPRNPSATSAHGYSIAKADTGVDYGEGSGVAVVVGPDDLPLHQERYLAGVTLESIAVDEPWFLWFCPNSPHTPLEPSDENSGRWPGVAWFARPGPAAYINQDVTAKPSWIQALTAPTLGHYISADTSQKLRLQEIADVDDTIGALWWALHATGRAADTTFIVTSDNGNHMLEHRISVGAKSTPYDIACRVPLICAGPGFTPNATVDVPVYASQDVAATVLDIHGASPVGAIDGTSLLDIAASPGDYASRATLGYRGNLDSVPTMPPADFVVVDQGAGLRKLIRYQGESGTDKYEAYDLDSDPHELTNWGNDSGRTAERDSLEGVLDGLLV